MLLFHPPRLLAALSILGLALAACSGNSQPESAAPPPAAPAPPPAPTVPATPIPAAEPWAGTWAYDADFDSGTLTITRRPDDAAGFSFALEAFSGSHSGELRGRARLQKGYARYVASPDESPCELIFRLNPDSSLTVEQPEGTCGAGAGVSFAGRYQREASGTRKAAPKEITLLSRGIFHSSAEDAAFRRLVGADYHRFAESAQLVSEDTTSEFPGATVYDAFVRGLGGVMASIIIVGPPGRLWAAVVAGDSVLYFTNQPEYANRLPATIRRWSGATVEENRIIEYKSQPR